MSTLERVPTMAAVTETAFFPVPGHRKRRRRRPIDINELLLGGLPYGFYPSSTPNPMDAVPTQQPTGPALTRLAPRIALDEEEAQQDEDIYQDAPDFNQEPEPPEEKEGEPHGPREGPKQGPRNTWGAGSKNAHIGEDINQGMTIKEVVDKYGYQPVKSFLTSVKDIGAAALPSAASYYYQIASNYNYLYGQLLKLGFEYGPHLVTAAAPVLAGTLSHMAAGQMGDGAPPGVAAMGAAAGAIAGDAGFSNPAAINELFGENVLY